MNTREKLIHYTSHAIRKRGFYGTGLREILEQTQIPKGSLYHHFPTGKEGLVREAISYNGEDLMARMKAAIKKKNVTQGLTSIIELFREELLTSEFKLADPIALVALEVAEEFPDLQRHSAIQYDACLRILTKFLLKRKVENADVVAKSFLARLVGTYLLAKVHQDATYFDAIESVIKQA